MLFLGALGGRDLRKRVGPTHKSRVSISPRQRWALLPPLRLAVSLARRSPMIKAIMATLMEKGRKAEGAVRVKRMEKAGRGLGTARRALLPVQLVNRRQSRRLIRLPSLRCRPQTLVPWVRITQQPGDPLVKPLYNYLR